MTDVSFALEAKSDQLNAVDIMGAEPVIRVREVAVKQGDQPVSVFYNGDNGKPWKPSKGMLRVLAAAWGRDSSLWVGRHVQLYFEPTVMWAGKEVGGIRIKALSDIEERGVTFALTINRQKREQLHIPLLKIDEKWYPVDKFDAAFPKMEKALKDGSMTVAQVVAQCQKTGRLNHDQLTRLEQAAPVEISNDDNEEDEVM